jgi:hypothetical protein
VCPVLVVVVGVEIVVATQSIAFGESLASCEFGARGDFVDSALIGVAFAVGASSLSGGVVYAGCAHGVGNPVGFRDWRAAVWVTNGSQVH